MVKDIVVFAVSTLLFFITQIFGILLGFLVVPIMLLFGKYDADSAKYFTDYNTHRKWIREKFPKVFWPWDNLEDSSTGDHRGWWDANSFGADSRKLINRFWWLAVRNPFNNFKRFVLGCDVRKYTITKLAGQDYVRDDFNGVGWQFLKAIPKDGWLPRYQLYIVKRYKDSDRALVVQIGNKIRLEHNNTVEADEYDYWKGWTLEINPFKDIS